MEDERNPVDYYKDIVMDISARMSRDAVWHDDMCTWIGYEAEKDEENIQVYKTSIGSDIANGNAGVLLFLNRLNKASNDPIAHKTIIGTRNYVKEMVSDRHDHIGFYTGDIGKIISLMDIGSFENDPNHNIEDYQVVLHSLLDFELEDRTWDTYSSISGIVHALLNNPNYTDDHIIHYLTKIHNHLISNLESSGLFNLPKTGYRKSIHGILTGALRLANFLEDEEGQSRIADAIQLTSSFHGSLIDTWCRSYNINDIINHSDFQPYSTGWSDGIAGNAKAILLQYQILPFAEQEKRAIDVAELLSEITIYAMSSGNWFANYSISHGLAGIGQVLILASDVLQNTKYLKLAEDIGHLGSQNIFLNGFDWPSGIYAPKVFGSKPTYGLLNGMAGTGMFYMDLIEKLEPQ